MGLKFDFNDFTEKLEELDKKTSKKVLTEALEKGGNVLKLGLKEEIKKRVYETGELYESIDITKIHATNNKSGYVDVGSKSEDEDIRARNWYQEYGNSLMNGKKHNIRSYLNNRDKALEAIGDYLTENLFK